MIKNLLMLLIVALIGWVVYVTFFGKPEEIELRNKLLSTGKEFGQSVADIFKSESNKVHSGEYDKVFDKLGEAIKNLKQADASKNQYADEIKRISDEKERLEKVISENKTTNADNTENNKKLKQLAEDIVVLTNKMEAK